MNRQGISRSLSNDLSLEGEASVVGVLEMGWPLRGSPADRLILKQLDIQFGLLLLGDEQQPMHRGPRASGIIHKSDKEEFV